MVFLVSSFSSDYDYTEEIPLSDVSDFCRNPNSSSLIYSKIKNPDDRAVLLDIFDCMYHRTARLLTVHFAAYIKQINTDSSPQNPISIVGMEQPLKALFLQTHLNFYLNGYLKDLGHHCTLEITNISPLIGSATAGLLA